MSARSGLPVGQRVVIVNLENERIACRLFASFSFEEAERCRLGATASLEGRDRSGSSDRKQRNWARNFWQAMLEPLIDRKGEHALGT